MYTLLKIHFLRGVGLLLHEVDCHSVNVHENIVMINIRKDIRKEILG